MDEQKKKVLLASFKKAMRKTNAEGVNQSPGKKIRESPYKHAPIIQ